MEDMGHFPMRESPGRFVSHLLPLLDRIESG